MKVSATLRVNVATTTIARLVASEKLSFSPFSNWQCGFETCAT
jgi:hypothetical protein